LSTTTTELSVSIPTPIDNPIRDIKFKDVPFNARNANVNITATGRAADTNSVALIFFKNKYNTIVARISPCTAVPLTFDIDWLISIDVSSNTLYTVSGGIIDSRLSSASSALLFKSIVLPSDDFSTITAIDSFPERYEISSGSSVVNTTLATSLSLKVFPLLFKIISLKVSI